MMQADPRAALARLVADRGEDYAGLSRLIGRNPSYIQQFVKRGVPRKLDGDDRRLLARYFGVDERVLGGDGEITSSRASPGAADGLILVPRLEVEASAGGGALPADERARGTIGFAAAFLRDVTGGRAGAASILSVTGDSMVPTLAAGDDILVVAHAPGTPLRDGIHVLRAEGMLLVKRIALNPAGGLSIRSDNPAYPAWECQPGAVDVVGRVVWTGRRL